VNARRILLVECIDATGASVRDARARARALQAAGYAVTSAAIASASDVSLSPPPAGYGDITLLAGANHRAESLRALVSGGGIDVVLVAAATPGGGEAGRWSAGVAPAGAYWWPTGVCARNKRGGHGPLQALALTTANGPAPAEPWPDACAGLHASVIDDTHAERRPLPLWDGDYVVAPAPLSGDAGRAALDAFARVCAEHDGLDLVVLADPQPEFEAIARAIGVGFRVHFAGTAPREAELAWLGAAGAVLIAGDAPLAGGFVLRALDRGCPIVPVPGAAVAAPLDAWLAAHGARHHVAGEELSARLERVLGRGADVRAAIDAGRAAARLAHIERFAPRMAAALAGTLEHRRAA
jgi:hypothetical protein